MSMSMPLSIVRQPSAGRHCCHLIDSLHRPNFKWNYWFRLCSGTKQCDVIRKRWIQIAFVTFHIGIANGRTVDTIPSAHRRYGILRIARRAHYKSVNWLHSSVSVSISSLHFARSFTQASRPSFPHNSRWMEMKQWKMRLVSAHH